jgi:CRISPR/Cas system-associated endoribonuclease Cas2
MALLVLSYDVRSKEHDYKKLYELLREWRAVPLQNSVWLVDRQGSASDVRDAVKAYTHSDDSIAVMELSPIADWATRNVREEAADWLQKKTD